MIYDVYLVNDYKVKEGKLLGFEPLDMNFKYSVKLICRDTIVEKISGTDVEPTTIKTYNLQYNYGPVGSVEVICALDREKAMNSYNKFRRFKLKNKNVTFNLPQFVDFANKNEFTYKEEIEEEVFKQNNICKKEINNIELT